MTHNGRLSEVERTILSALLAVGLLEGAIRAQDLNVAVKGPFQVVLRPVVEDLIRLTDEALVVALLLASKVLVFASVALDAQGNIIFLVQPLT